VRQGAVRTAPNGALVRVPLHRPTNIPMPENTNTGQSPPSLAELEEQFRQADERCQSVHTAGNILVRERALAALHAAKAAGVSRQYAR